MTKRPYIESHSALRGIAAFVVVLDHMRAFQVLPKEGTLGHLFAIFSWNGPAVFLFFILSGYVMSYVYPSPVPWRHFFVARAARLLPVYEVTLLLYLAQMLATIDDRDIRDDNVLANFLMIQQWLPIPGWHSINFPSWSLSVEAFLYLFAFPLLICTRGKLWNRWLYASLIVLGSAWEAIYYFCYDKHALFIVWAFALLNGITGFGLGFAVHSLIQKGLRWPNLVAAAGVVVTVGTIVIHAIFPTDVLYGVLAMGLVLLVAGSANPEGWLYRSLSVRPLLYLGDISYSLYLWHIAVLFLLQHLAPHIKARFPVTAFVLDSQLLFAALIVVCALVVATASYYLLEVPFRRMIRDRFVRPQPGAHTAA